MSPLLLDVLAGKLSPDQARAKDPTFDAQWDALRVASKRREDLPSPPDRTRRMEVEPTPRELTERARKELAKRRAPAPLPPEERKWSDLISRSIAKVEKELEETAKLPWTLDLCGMLVIPPVKSDDEEELDKRARLAWKPQAQILLEAAKGVGASYRELEKQIPEKDRPELERRIVDAIRNAERLGPWLTARCETLRKEWESRGRKALPVAPPPVAPSRSSTPPVPSPRTPPASSTRAAPAKPPRPPAAKPARRRAAPPLILPAGWPKHRPTTPCLCPTTKRRAVLVGPQSGWRCRTRRGIFAATPAACNRRRR